MNISSDYAVQMRDISKSFGKIVALNKINIDIKKGTIHAILGENGAGKTTLMNILYGLLKKDSGEIFIKGEKIDIKNSQIAIKNGIGMVHQHFKLIKNFTVLQNIMLGCETTNKFGFLKNKSAHKKIAELSKKYNLDIKLDTKIEDISVGMQQRVEILKTLYRGADILIFDEPTAVLNPNETNDLIKTMQNLAKDGKTIIIITHKLKEIKKAASFCTIIRAGSIVDTLNVSKTPIEELAKKMIGQNLKINIAKKDHEFGDIIFEIDNLCIENKKTKNLNAVDKLSLKIRKGEIFGIAGVDGNGQKELVEAITNLITVKSGSIKINGNEIQNTNIKNVINNKVSTIYDDRHARGIILDMSVKENVILEKYKAKPFSKRGILKQKSIDKFTESLLNKYSVKPEKCSNSKIRNLSGGNQQKVVIGREISNNPDLLIAVQPTRGLDIGAIKYVHEILVEQRNKGKAILLISLDLDEILDLSDTISVIYNGKISNTFKQNEIDEKTLGVLMTGGKLNG